MTARDFYFLVGGYCIAMLISFLDFLIRRR